MWAAPSSFCCLWSVSWNDIFQTSLVTSLKEFLPSLNYEIPIGIPHCPLLLSWSTYSSTMERQVFNGPIYFPVPFLSVLLFHNAIFVSTSSFSCHIFYIVTVVPLYLFIFLLLFLELKHSGPRSTCLKSIIPHYDFSWFFFRSLKFARACLHLLLKLS